MLILPEGKKTVSLKRAQMSALRFMGQAYVDVTAKSGEGMALFFAPPWELVMGHKQGRITDEAFTEVYEQQLAALSEDVWLWLYQLGGSGSITLCCYCADGKFCHSLLIIDHALRRYPSLFDDGREERQHARSTGRYLQWRA